MDDSVFLCTILLLSHVPETQAVKLDIFGLIIDTSDTGTLLISIAVLVGGLIALVATTFLITRLIRNCSSASAQNPRPKIKRLASVKGKPPVIMDTGRTSDTASDILKAVHISVTSDRSLAVSPSSDYTDSANSQRSFLNNSPTSPSGTGRLFETVTMPISKSPSVVSNPPLPPSPKTKPANFDPSRHKYPATTSRSLSFTDRQSKDGAKYSTPYAGSLSRAKPPGSPLSVQAPIYGVSQAFDDIQPSTSASEQFQGDYSTSRPTSTTQQSLFEDRRQAQGYQTPQILSPPMSLPLQEVTMVDEAIFVEVKDQNRLLADMSSFQLPQGNLANEATVIGEAEFVSQNEQLKQVQ